MRTIQLCLAISLVWICTQSFVDAAPALRPTPSYPPTLEDLWYGRAIVGPRFEVMTGLGPDHQRLSFAPAPEGQILAFTRAQCANKSLQQPPFCIYRTMSSDGLHFDEEARSRVLEKDGYDADVIRLPNGWYLMAFEANGRTIALAASSDGQHWKELRRNFVASCAGDPGLCKTLGGAPDRGTTDYGRFSVSTPGLTYIDTGDGTYTILLYFGVRVTGDIGDEAQLYLGLRRFSVPADGEPQPTEGQYERELVLASDPNGAGWDARSIASPVIRQGRDGAFYMLYGGGPLGYLNIGQPVGIGLARSTDGVHWEKYRGTGLLMPATQPATPGDIPNLERGARSYPAMFSLGRASYIAMAYRGADDEQRSDYFVRYRLFWAR